MLQSRSLARISAKLHDAVCQNGSLLRTNGYAAQPESEQEHRQTGRRKEFVAHFMLVLLVQK